MVNMDKENDEVDLEVTDEEQQMKKEDSEIIDIEEETGDKLKKLRDKLAHCEKEKNKYLKIHSGQRRISLMPEKDWKKKESEIEPITESNTLWKCCHFATVSKWQ